MTAISRPAGWASARGCDGGRGRLSCGAVKAPSKGAAWIWGGLALAVNALSLGVALDASWWAPDDGYYANVAQRVLDGEVLHRDVQEIHPGAIVAINAAALRLFGTSLLALRMPLAAGCVVTGLVLSWIFRRRSPALGFLAALAPTLLGVLQFANPSAHWYSLFLFFVLVLCVVEVAPGSAGRVAALGVLLGLVLLLRQLSGVIVGVGLVAWLLLEERRPSISRPWIARSVLGLAWLGVAAYLVRVTDPTGFVLFGLAPLALLAWHWPPSASMIALPPGSSRFWLAASWRPSCPGCCTTWCTGRCGRGGPTRSWPPRVCCIWSSWAALGWPR